MSLRYLGASLALLVAAVGVSPAVAQWKPTSPVEVVVHTGPGGGNDALGRAMLGIMDKEKLLPVRFQISNKVGGGSATAMNYMREKKGDPNVITIFSSVYVSNPLVQPEASVTMDDLTPIARLVLEPALVVVRTDSPYKTLKDFIDAAKQKPNQLKQSGGSVLSRDAVVRQVLVSSTGAQWPFISFPSGGERIAALLGGHVDMMMIEPSEAGEHIRSGKLRPIAQVSEARLEAFKDVPTIKEAGFNIPNVPQARGIVGPPDMPKEAVAYYADLFKKVSESPGWKKYLDDTHLQNAYQGPDELARFNKQYADQLRTILKDAGVKVIR
ncbi:MAG TPA: tripartite tricarboxylate transporter substrate binding protein [Beijerinckiaceae bacterium]|nr:tripartite tricarboxylate transporter substrate binding protein [Beijerinckiaceae bacterium]